MTNLIDNIGKGFLNSNSLHDRKIVNVYVENEDDVPFWKHIFNKSDIQTSITPQVKDKEGLTRGKDNILSYENQTNKYFILCVDSDYDYLIDGETERSEKIKNNCFIFQTYTYSIENYQCFADSLNQVLLEATLNDNLLFDFIAFMKQYSKIVYDLFIYSFFYDKNYRKEIKLCQEIGSSSQEVTHLFTIEDFCKTIKITDKINIFDTKDELSRLKEKTTEKIASLPKIDNSTLDDIKRKFIELGLTEDNTYLFIKGHAIEASVLIVLLKVREFLVEEKFKEYKRYAKTEQTKKTELKDKINEYKNRVCSKKDDKEMSLIEIILKSHKNYQSCSLMPKIENDIKGYKHDYLS